MTQNFKLDEFACHDGTIVPMRYIGNIMLLAEQLEVLRARIKKPIKILSGYRTPQYNSKVGGVPKSMHLQGMAADITVKGMSPTELYYEIENLIAQAEMLDGGLGLYDTFVHYDIRKKSTRW